ncbi:class I SAM-dependent methyltransferase [Virgibacillus pantothenticus]|uniref:class I SAM-dependent methyltransferase n=1 Tax=Virgibacillus pantothenticus TaxID=1473 RepID=UPI003D182050
MHKSITWISSVVGIDFSDAMLRSSKEHWIEYGGITFQKGNTYKTGLSDNLADLVYNLLFPGGNKWNMKTF